MTASLRRANAPAAAGRGLPHRARGPAMLALLVLGMATLPLAFTAARGAGPRPEEARAAAGLARPQVQGPLTYTLAQSWTLPSIGPTVGAPIAPEQVFFDDAGQPVLYAPSGRFSSVTELVGLTQDGEISWRAPLDAANTNAHAEAVTLDGPSGQVFVAFPRRGIFRRPLGGTLEKAWDFIGSSTYLPSSLYLGPDDVLYAFTSAGVSRYGPRTQRRADWPVRIGPDTTALPGSLVVGPEGHVYLVDRSLGGGVYRFSAQGVRDADWRLDVFSALTGPLARSPAREDIYVLDGGGAQAPMSVRVFDATGATRRMLPVDPLLVHEPRPRLAVAPDGGYALLGRTLWGWDALFLHRADGTLRARIYTQYTGPGDPSDPATRAHMDVAPGGQITVLSPYPGRVRSFGADGVLAESWSTPSQTVDVAMLPDGDVLLQRTAPRGPGARIERHARDGALRWARPVSASSAAGLTADARFVYIAGAARGTIDVLSAADGDFQGRLDETPRRTLGPHDLDLGPAGRVYALDRWLREVGVWDPAGSLPGPEARIPLGDTSRASRIAAGPGGRVAVLAGQSVELRDAAGARLWSLSDAPEVPASLFPLDVGFDGAGRLVVLAEDRPTLAPVDFVMPQPIVYVFEPGEPSGPARPSPSPSPSPSPAPTPLPSAGGRCIVTGDKTAHPRAIRLGEEVTVTLSLAGACPAAAASPADIVLAVDVSGSMSGEPARAAGRAVRAFIEGIDLANGRIGVVVFNTNTSVVQPLTDDPRALAALPEDFGASGGTSIATGLRLADEHLAERGRQDARPVIVLLSDGQSDRSAAQGAALAARARGVEIYTVGLGAADIELLLLIAGDPRRFSFALGPEELEDIYRQIARQLTLAGRHVLLEDELGPDVDLVPGSAAPPPWSPPSRVLRWRVEQLPAEPMTLTYRLRPTRAGRLPTNRAAWFDYQDADGTRRRFVYPQPYVDVLAPSATPTATPTPSATPSPTPTPRPLFLPLALAESCAAEERRVDAVLLIDASTSMLASAGDGASKLDAARTAAGSFLDQLRLSAGDRASIVAFNREARVLQGLSADRAALAEALRRIEASPQTCLPCAMEAAGDLLAPHLREPGRVPVVVLLTDGRSNPRPAEEAVTVAERLARGGVAIHVIGLGLDLDFDALLQIASEPGHYHHAPTAEDLATVYRSIASTIPCPVAELWGRR